MSKWTDTTGRRGRGRRWFATITGAAVLAAPVLVAAPASAHGTCYTHTHTYSYRTSTYTLKYDPTRNDGGTCHGNIYRRVWVSTGLGDGYWTWKLVDRF